MSAEYGASARDFELISKDREQADLTQTPWINGERKGHPGFGVALVWLCTPEYMPSICLVYGFAVALGGFARSAQFRHSTKLHFTIDVR
jgi:hypothetical protein